MNDHPTPAELEDLVWSRVSAERAREIVAHLLHGCKPCCEVIAPHLTALLGLGEPPERILSPAEEAEYDTALDRAFAAALKVDRELRERGRREAPVLHLDPRLDEVPDVPAHLRGVPLFEALLERSWALRHDDPEEMVRFAQAARALVEGLSPEGLSEQSLLDLRCRAWMELGNAYRVADHLAEAEAALCEAAKLFRQGSQDELLAARLFDSQASLYGDQRRFDIAQTALDLVYAIYKRRGDGHLAGRALIIKGMYTGYEGESEEAVRLIRQGLELIDEARDPGLVFVAAHNHVRFLVDCGQLREARITLFRLRSRGLDAGGRINELKVRWLEGQINAGLGELDRAEQALLEVKEGFKEAGLVYKAALAGLELGAMLLRRGSNEAARSEILQAADTFINLGIGRETGASLLLLRKMFERRMTDAVLLEYVIGRLQQLQNAPDRPDRPGTE
ncbi:MAG TPA: hypothetical protein VGG03_24275 [Thermoanaerobaculia bacterium]